MNLGAREITDKLPLDNRLNCFVKSQAFTPLKDYKETFKITLPQS